MNLKTIQDYAQTLATQQGWDKETIQTRLHYLKSEIIEATEEINNVESATSTEEQQKHQENLGLELFDILWNVAEIANRYGVDLEQASQQKISINNQRSFSKKPKEVHMVAKEEATEEGKVYEETFS